MDTVYVGGRSELDGDGSRERPCRSIAEAVARARGAGAGCVRLLPGRHSIAEPIRLGPEDSGLIIEGDGADRTFVDGGVEINEWRETTFNGRDAFQADVRSVLHATGRPFRSLFVDGARMPRGRWPVEGYLALRPEGNHDKTNRFDGSSAPSLADPSLVPREFTLEGAELRVLHKWVDERMPIRAWDRETGVVQCDVRSVQRMTGQTSGWQAERAFLENVPEAVIKPGQWYLDERAGTLTVIAPEGETPERFTAVVPVTLQFLRLEGRFAGDAPAALEPINDVVIRGVCFEHTDWVQPLDDAGLRFDPHVNRERWAHRDSAVYLTSRFVDKKVTSLASSFQAGSTTPGAILLSGAHNCSITECTIRHAGYYGVELAEGCVGNTIADSTLSDLGGGGVNADGGNDPADPSRHLVGNRFLRNEISGVGRVFLSSCGILICYGSGNRIVGNHIHDLRYTGVSVGWTWDRARQMCRENLIAENHIHDIRGTDILSDLAGIYTLGIQPGTVIRGNTIHDVEADAYGACGIYTDAASACIAVEGNTIADIAGIGINVNAENCENVYRGNVLSRVRDAVISINRNPREFSEEFGEIGRAATIVGNRYNAPDGLVYRFVMEPGTVSISELADMVWTACNTVSTECTPGDELHAVAARSLSGEVLATWDEWLATGQDAGTVFER